MRWGTRPPGCQPEPVSFSTTYSTYSEHQSMYHVNVLPSSKVWADRTLTAPHREERYNPRNPVSTFNLGNRISFICAAHPPKKGNVSTVHILLFWIDGCSFLLRSWLKVQKREMYDTENDRGKHTRRKIPFIKGKQKINMRTLGWGGRDL